MSVSTRAAVESSVDTAGSRPLRTLQVLRIVAIVHSLGMIIQPALAGVYLDGEVDALALHELNAHIVTGLGVVQLLAAIAFVWKGRGRTWPLHATIGLVVAVQLQVGLGFGGVVAAHVPLGVSIVSMQILLTVWLCRAAASAPRRPRRRST